MRPSTSSIDNFFFAREWLLSGIFAEIFDCCIVSEANSLQRVYHGLIRLPHHFLQIAQQENLVPTDEEIDKMIAERAERTKKTVEEIREKTNIPALKRAEAIHRAADWVIERSTIEEK